MNKEAHQGRAKARYSALAKLTEATDRLDEAVAKCFETENEFAGARANENKARAAYDKAKSAFDLTYPAIGEKRE